MQTISLESVVINQKNTRISVIWLHGLGADGYDFVPIVDALRLPHSEQIKFIFPHAPKRPVTLNGGTIMRAWYDLYSIQNENQADCAHVQSSICAIHQLVQHEIESGTPANRIFLAGFSQGAVIALYAGLQFSSTLAGIIALSGYTPHAEHFAPITQIHPPIFLPHGKQDEVVPFVLNARTRSWLDAHRVAFNGHDYNMAHEVSAEEIDALRQWMLLHISST